MKKFYLIVPILTDIALVHKVANKLTAAGGQVKYWDNKKVYDPAALYEADAVVFIPKGERSL